MLAKDLAAAVGLSPSSMSLIESGERSVKASELVALADVLGISPLALLEPDSLVGRVSIAARTTEATHAGESALLRRLQGVAEVASLLSPESRDVVAIWDWSAKPVADLSDWLGSARALASWALESAATDDPRPDDFVKTALYIEQVLGVDVIVEEFDDAVIGGAIVGSELPIVIVNTRQGRQRALFTLAHELGHVLAADGKQIACDVDFSAKSPSERFANAFAAEFLAPIATVKRLMNDVSDVRVSVARLMLFTGLSKQTSIYRLHNLGVINATQRDALMRLHVSELAAADPDSRNQQLLLTRSDELAPRTVTPMRLLTRLIEAYRVGLVSAAPIAGILGTDIDYVIDRFGYEPEDQTRDEMNFRTADPVPSDEAAYDGVPA